MSRRRAEVPSAAGAGIRATPVQLIEEVENFLQPTVMRSLLTVSETGGTRLLAHSESEGVSIQSRILFASTSGNLSHPLWKRRERAEESSIRLLGNTILGAQGTRVAHLVASKKYFDAIALRYAEINAEAAMAIPLFKKIVLSRLDENDAGFFIQLGTYFSKSRSRKRIPQLNFIALKMAEHWTHPDAPLWMMNNEAGSRYVGHLLSMNVSADNFSQIVKREALVRFGKFPIRGVRISKQKEFLGFELSRWVDLKG
jgi:hypothetical protein